MRDIVDVPQLIMWAFKKAIIGIKSHKIPHNKVSHAKHDKEKHLIELSCVKWGGVSSVLNSRNMRKPRPA